ncbi:MAG: sugar kinase [Carbonactinosporaceae bacterium]
MSAPEVVTFGESMALLLAEPGHALDAALHFRRSVAGAESNVAVGLARLGHAVGWFGRVGDDAFGHGILRALRAEGVDVSRARIDDTAPTGLLVRDFHAERPVQVLYYRSGSAGSRLSPADVDEAWLGGARLLHVTGITPALSRSAREATEAVFDVAARAGVTMSFDPNVRRKLASERRWGELLPRFGGRAHLVFAGVDEAELITGTSDPERAAGWFLERGARLVVIKDGGRGAWASDGTRSWRCPATRVTAADPVGAGDAFDAGFLSGYLRGLAVADALAEAAVVGAHVVQAPGDLEGLPTARQRDAAARPGQHVDR